MMGAGEATINCAFKTIQEGDELNAGVKREYAVGACLAVCSDVLPPGFRASVAQGFPAACSSGPGKRSKSASARMSSTTCERSAAQAGRIRNVEVGMGHDPSRKRWLS
jgi:hypothetical protein